MKPAKPISMRVKPWRLQQDVCDVSASAAGPDWQLYKKSKHVHCTDLPYPAHICISYHLHTQPSLMHVQGLPLLCSFLPEPR
jgi:hypothetical protein